MSMSIGFYPFWFWNDYLTKEEIQRQIREMADKGIKGFFIHSRQGLKQPYLSESFFEMFDIAIKEAEKHNMIVNLYDEYPYPSGIAGGEVIMGRPEYYATDLVQEVDIIKGGNIRKEYPAGQILSAKAYPYKNGEVVWEEEIDLSDYIGIVLVEDSYVETGLTNYNQKRYFASKPTPVLDIYLPEDQYKVFVSIQIEVIKHKYWDKFVDILNKDAVQRFIELTHERYKKRYGDKFGSSIAAIFTDEIHPTWSARIITAFQKEYGYNLLDFMPALVDSSHSEHLRVRYDLNKLKYKLFCSAYEEIVAKWCQDNNILYAGEKPALRLSQLKYMDIPGCDAGHKKVGSQMSAYSADIRGNAKAVASAAYFYDKESSLCECYHSLGWSGTIQDAKFNADEILSMGIDILVPHGFFYSTHGLKKHDAPPSFFYQMPFWPLFGKLSERLEVIKREFADTYLDAEIILIDPTSGLYSQDDLSDYQKINSLLYKNHLDFLIADTDILQLGNIQDGTLKLKDLNIKLIIVPSMQKMGHTLTRWLKDFRSAGGEVIYYEGNNDFAGFEKKIKEIISPQLSIKQNGHEVKEIMISKRKNKERTIWFIINTSNRKFNTVINTVDNQQIKELLLDKEYTLLKKGDKNYERVIYPFESFILETEPTNGSEEKTNFLPEITVDVYGEAELLIKDKNLLRMNKWEMSLLDNKSKIVNRVSVETAPLSNQLKRAGFSFKPEYQEYFGHRPEIDFPDLILVYEYNFENNYSGDIELLMEPDTIQGEWKIKINNKKEFTLEDFSESNSHVKGSLAVSLNKYLDYGTNNIKVNVKVSKASDGLINPLYLAGKFGVTLDPVTIVEQKKKGLFEEYKDNLLPYYSGVIEYKTTFNLDKIPASEYVLLELNYKSNFHEATEISINDGSFQVVLWEPRIIKIVSSRLNIGENTLITRVYTTLVRSFEGKKFDYQEHLYRN